MNLCKLLAKISFTGADSHSVEVKNIERIADSLHYTYNEFGYDDHLTLRNKFPALTAILKVRLQRTPT